MRECGVTTEQDEMVMSALTDEPHKGAEAEVKDAETKTGGAKRAKGCGGARAEAAGRARDQRPDQDAVRNRVTDKGDRRLCWISLLVVLVGLGIAVELTLVHHRARQNVSSGCDISQKVSCSSIALTPEAVFLGVPISVWGFCTYAVFGALALWALFWRERRGWPWGFFFWGGLACVVYSLWLAYLAYVEYGFICLWCTALYGVNTALLVLGVVGLRRNGRGLVGGLISDVKVVAARYRATLPLIALAVVVAGLLMAYYPEPSAQAKAVEVSDAELAQKIKVGRGGGRRQRADGSAGQRRPQQRNGTKTGADIRKNGIPMVGKYKLIEKRTPWIGAENPEVILVEFSDYECPFCKRAHLNVKKAFRKYKDRMRLYHRHFPLDHHCNRIVTRPYHPHACHAAKAAICARAQGKFWEMDHQLFLNKKSHHGAALLKLAEKVGLKIEPFQQCMDQKETLAEVKKDIEVALALKAKGTPTFVFYGPHLDRVVVSGLINVKLFDRLFEKLDEAKARAAEARSTAPRRPAAQRDAHGRP